MKIALVHDYLREAGGAERVLKVIAEMYPEAPIYTAFAKNGTAKELLNGHKIIESSWAPILRIGRFYSYLRFLLPWVWKSVDLRQYDLVITSCSAYIARGFRVNDQTKVIAYCHTPPKWLYGYKTPTQARGKWWGRAYLFVVGPFVRYFDFVSAQRVNVWIANSHEVAARIAKFYRKSAVVVYPPVSVREVERTTKRETYMLTVARMVGAKGLELAAMVAKQTKRQLVMVGEVVGGRKVLEAIRRAGGSYITIKGRVSESELATLYAGAKLYLALAKDEDFGMTVVEAMARGTPVLAINSGGYKETVVSGETGILVEQEDVNEIVLAIEEMDKIKWDREKIKRRAERYDLKHFEQAMRRIVGA